MSIKKPSFIIDLSSSMVVSVASDESNISTKGQILYCKCSSIQKFNGKLVRNVIKNYDELTEDSESLKSITCTSCNTVYDNLEKLYLLEPNVTELYGVTYSVKVEEEKFVLSRVKNVVEYISGNRELKFSESLDFLEIDMLNKTSKLTLSKPFVRGESSIRELSVKKNEVIDSSIKGKDSESFDLDITNVAYLEEFFFYSDSIKYTGFDNVLKSLELIKKQIKDLDKFNSVYFIDFIKSKSQIQIEKDEFGNVEYYQNLDSGFGDGEIVKKKLNLGDYLFNSMNSYKLMLSILSFESASCIIHTKGYNFFKAWTESTFICKPDVYMEKKATNPQSIMEVSMALSKGGASSRSGMKDLVSSGKIFDSEFLKVSSTIYNSIKIISHLETLNKSYLFEITSKNQLEFLLQNFEQKRIYEVLSKVVKSRNLTDDICLSFKNIRHILDCKMDKSSNDYVTIYRDSLRVVDLLEVKQKVIFKCKNFKQLKDLHDDYTSRYNVMKDAKKSEFYKKSTSDFKHLNTQVGDVKFEIVDTAERLNLEGLQMHHCIYTYLNRICDKKYLAINVTHMITGERATAGFVRNGKTIELEQLKGYYNSRATKELIDSIFVFCSNNKIQTKTSFSSDMNPDSSRQRLMPGQMSEQELFIIRKENVSNVSIDNAEEKGLVKNIIKKIFK